MYICKKDVKEKCLHKLGFSLYVEKLKRFKFKLAGKRNFWGEKQANRRIAFFCVF